MRFPVASVLHAFKNVLFHLNTIESRLLPLQHINTELLHSLTNLECLSSNKSLLIIEEDSQSFSVEKERPSGE